MAPKTKFTRAEMTVAALQIVRERGVSALTARSVAEVLRVSTQPVFTCFHSMEELRREVLSAAREIYDGYIQEGLSAEIPFYGVGMAYIRFSKEERELFRLLFMRDRSGEIIGENLEEIRPLLDLIRKNTGLSEREAYLFHLEMWIYVHGIATMLATSYLEWDAEFISNTLTDSYQGLRHRFCVERKDPENGQ